MDRLIFGANWYVDTLNTHLSLASVQLPSLARAKETFVTGGGFFNLEVPDAIEGLEADFSLNGSDERVRGLFGREAGDWTSFYYYERLRDIQEGRNLGRVVKLKGLIDTVDQPTATGKKGDAAQYKVGTIVEYKDIVDGKLIHHMEYFSNRLIVDGVNYSEENNRLLAIAG
ncbi:MAG: phage major tail tube protein [Pseudomonadota bacterium]